MTDEIKTIIACNQNYSFIFVIGYGLIIEQR